MLLIHASELWLNTCDCRVGSGYPLRADDKTSLRGHPEGRYVNHNPQSITKGGMTA